MSNFAVIDVETSGLDLHNNAVCKVTIGVYNRKYEKIGYLDNFIKPYDAVYTEKAFEINKLSKEILEEHGYDVLYIASEILNIFENESIDFIVGHNVHFDIGFITKLVSKVSTQKAYKISKIKKIDTLYLNYPKSLKNRKLHTICKYYNIEHQDVHNSTIDEKATFELFKMINQHNLEFIQLNKK